MLSMSPRTSWVWAKARGAEARRSAVIKVLRVYIV
jgi:hypothetical protein